MRLLPVLLIGLLAAGPAWAASAPGVTPLAERATIHTNFTPNNIYPMVVAYGVERGYYEAANIDLKIDRRSLAAPLLAPMLARGDLDLAPQTESPSFFNLTNQGFPVKAVATFTSVKEGREEDTWILLSKRDVGKIKALGDLKGGVVEAGPIGSGAHFLVLAALAKAGLVPGKDVTVTNKARSAADFVALAKADSQDAVGSIEPQATFAEKQGYAVRWKSLADAAPWAQSVVMATSEDFAAKHGDALRKFLEIYVVSAREINQTNGVWTDELMKLVTGWTGMEKDVIASMGGVPYLDPNPTVSAESMTRSQTLWVDAGTLAKPTDVNALIDNKPMEDALAVVGRQ